MRAKSVGSFAVFASAFIVLGWLPVVNARTLAALAQGTDAPKISAGEQKLADAITAAPDPAAKLKAAAAFIKKYPKSALRPKVAALAADQIAGVTDAAQKISLAQEYQTIFNDPSDQELIMPVLIDGLASANRFDEAFAKGTEYLTAHPDSLRILVRLMTLGTDQAKQRNPKFVEQSVQYGAHAIQLIESKKIPAGMNEASWRHYESLLPGLYQSLGVLNLVKGDRVEARARLTRATELAPADPFNYLFLVDIYDAEYQEGAKRYQSMPNSQAKNDEYPKVLASLDKVIDFLARMIALSEGNATLEQIRQQSLKDFEAYYRYRHNNSTEGMQPLIDKYKTTVKP